MFFSFERFAQKCPIESDSMSVTILDETVSKVEFVMRQLLELVGLLDLSDEIGRYVHVLGNLHRQGH